jgi:hypothetical protein
MQNTLPRNRLVAVSDNYKLYAAKMAELRAYRSANRPLHGQFDDLIAFVKTCEGQWESRRRTERDHGWGYDHQPS